MPASETAYHFGRFRVEPSQRRLLRNGEPVPLTGKAFDTLLTLLRNSGSLVTKQALLNAVWPDVVVDEANLTFTMSLLRKALGERGGSQRYIETVPKQGYRFRATVAEAEQAAVSFFPPRPTLGAFVERERETDLLLNALQLACSGQPQARFISGEAGTGKTALVQQFAARTLQAGGVLIAFGSCIDHKSQSEPYFPLLQALGMLARTEHRELVTRALRVHAPTWSARMPLVQEQAPATSRSQSQERMLREIEEALFALTRKIPLVVILEDLHWCDYATVDFVARVARMAQGAQLLLVGTWRPADAKGRKHPIHTLIHEVCFRRPECLITVASLSSTGVEEALSHRFPQGLVPVLRESLYSRTGGNPLFIDSLLQHWLTTRALREDMDGWHFDAGSASEIPSTIRELIEQQIAMLPQLYREVLEAAAIARPQTWLRAIAAALHRDVEEVETTCAELARSGVLFRRTGEFEYPDGEAGQAFEFTHALYAEVIGSAIPPRRCMRLHQSIGAFLERAFAARLETIAGSLGVHFREAREPGRAIKYLLLAARHAYCDGAPRDALVHLNNASRLVPRLADLSDREEAELAIEHLRGPVLIATGGFASTEAESSFHHALALAERRGSDLMSEIAFGLAALLEIRGQYRDSQNVLHTYDPEHRDGGHEAEWRHLLACSTFHQGQFSAALDHARNGLRLSPPDAESDLLRDYGEHPRVECHTWAALALWFLGFPDRALTHAQAAAALVETPRHGYAMANGSAQIAMLHQLRREPRESLSRAQATVESGKRQGMPYRIAIGKAISGWARGQLGGGSEAVEEIRSALSMCEAIGANLDRPYFLGLLGETLIQHGALNEAEYALSAALDQVQRAHSFFYEAELRRLCGCVLARRSCAREALIAFRHSWEIARQQGARSLELRSLVSLVEVAPEAEVRVILADAYGWFSEGLNLPDLRIAAELCGSHAAHRA